MAVYRARLIDASTAGCSEFDFEARDDLMSDTPVRIARAFFDATPQHLFPVPHRDWEVNHAHKSAERQVACVGGVLHLTEGAPLPYCVFIAPKG